MIWTSEAPLHLISQSIEEGVTLHFCSSRGAEVDGVVGYGTVPLANTEHLLGCFVTMLGSVAHLSYFFGEGVIGGADRGLGIPHHRSPLTSPTG